MSVYFLQAKLTNHVKIGYARDARQRSLSIGGGVAGGVKFCGYLPGGRDLEKHLHNRFREHRVSGEWFEPAAELLTFIENYTIHGLPSAEQMDPFERLRLQDETYIADAQDHLHTLLRNLLIRDQGTEEQILSVAQMLGVPYGLLRAIQANDIDTITAGTRHVLKCAAEKSLELDEEMDCATTVMDSGDTD